MKMNVVRRPAALAACLLLATALFAAGPAPARGAAQAIAYACPMHPEVTSDRPGKCPKCGMYLEAKAAGKVTYVCPMHPEVASDKPGKCPKCGMFLEAVVKSSESPSAPPAGRSR